MNTADLGESHSAVMEPGRAIRRHFPVFDRSPDLHYLDSAASAQKPASVIGSLTAFLENQYANIHRGAYGLSADATAAFDASRRTVAEFIGAKSEREIVFTRGATEGVNLVAAAFTDLALGSSVVTSLLEHHSNVVPWQLAAERRGISLHYARIDPAAQIDLDDLRDKIYALRPALVAVTMLSNAFGTVTPVREIIQAARDAGSAVLLDAAQSAQHIKIDVAELDADFLVFSGHKLYGPTGVGVLYINERMHGRMSPYQGGGDMIRSVSVEGSEWAEPPHKFEAGTPAIAEVIALRSAIEFVQQIGFERIAAHEEKLFDRAFELLSKQPGVELYGPAAIGRRSEQCSIISFNLRGVHPHDLSTVADSFKVQIRGGHHCAMPALKKLGLAASARASIGLYTTVEDFEALCEAIARARTLFM